MREADSVEAALARLMPTALSSGGQRAIEATLEELAGGSPGRRRLSWRSWGIGLSACAAAIAGGFAHRPLPKSPEPVPISQEVSPLEWLDKFDRVESLHDEGRLSGTEGDALQAIRLRVVEEKTLRDRETGCTFKVTEPRDEWVFMPVSNF